MRAILTSLALLCLPVTTVAQKVSLDLKVVSILAPKNMVEIRLHGEALTVAKGEGKAVAMPLSKEHLEGLRKAILAAPRKKWSGLWVSPACLDGYLLSATLTLDGRRYVFSGVNGCPPGLSRVLSNLFERTKEPLLGAGWEEMEKSARRFDSFQAYQEWISEHARARKSSQIPP